MVEPAHVLLSGIVGSTAYGLATPESDIDRLGVFAAPTEQLHGLHMPQQSIVTTAPDRALHEAAKFASLCLGGNPTVTELLWLPEDLYEVRTELGDDLIGIRSAFLSARRARAAYLGYAEQQFRKLEARGDGSFSADTRHRTAKHARHMARLIHQGRELYATGRLPVRLDNPDWYRAFGERVADGDLEEARFVLAEAEVDFNALHTPLPERPDTDCVERWLRGVRSAHFQPAPAPNRGVVLVDLDGTTALRDVADPDVREPFEFERVGEDLPNEPVITVVRALAAAGHPIVYISGRSDRCARQTGVWIAEHIRVPGVELLMRTEGDHRPDTIVKQEIYERRIEPRYEVTAVLDDRAAVVRMWRALGLTVLQVAEGNF